MSDRTKPPPGTVTVGGNYINPVGWCCIVIQGAPTEDDAIYTAWAEHDLVRNRIEAETVAAIVAWLRLAMPDDSKDAVPGEVVVMEIADALEDGDWKR